MTTEQVRVTRDRLRAELGREPLLRELVERAGGSRRTVARYLATLNANERTGASGVGTPPSTPAPPVTTHGMGFADLAMQVHSLADVAEWDFAQVAERLTQRGIPPALGAPAWSKQVVDRVLVHAASLQRGLAALATPSPLVDDFCSIK